MGFETKIEKPDDKESAAFVNEQQRKNLIDVGVNFAKTDPQLAEEFFKKARASMQEVQVALAADEFNKAAKQERKRIMEMEEQQRLETMYNKIIKQAK